MDDEEQSVAVADATEAPAEATEPNPLADDWARDDAPAAETVQPEAAEPEPDYDEILSKIPAEKLRGHTRVAGIVGSELQTRFEQWQAQNQARAHTEAQHAAHEELITMARDNPTAFADKFLQDDEAAQARNQVLGLHHNARADIVKSIGAAFSAIPEWADIVRDPEAWATLTRATTSVPDDQAVAAFNRTASELLADRRAKVRFEEWRKTELPKEREAMRAEVSAELLNSGPAPDIARGRRATSTDPEPSNFHSKEWESWYSRQSRGA